MTDQANATEKQIEYIKALIEKRRPENMMYLNTLNNQYETAVDQQHKIFYNRSRIEFLMDIYGIGRRDEKRQWEYEQVIEWCNSEINRYNQIDFGALTKSAASTLIDEIKI